MVVVQTGDLTGLIPRFSSSVPCGDELLYVRVEEDVEGLAGLAVDVVDVLDVEPVEERLVGDPPERVVDAHVELVAVAGELQTVVEVSLGLGVFDVAGIDLGFEECHAPCDYVLLLFHQVQGHGAFQMGVQQLDASVVEVVAFGEVGAAFALRGFVQSVELGVDQLPERGDDVSGDLDVLVVVLDGRLHVGHEHGLPLAVSSLGMPAGAEDVGVDDALTASRVHQDQPGTALPTVHAAF